MLKQFVYSPLLRILLLAVIAVQLVACGGGSDTGAGSASVTAADGTMIADVSDEIVLSGSVGDGPVTGATIEIWSARGRLIGTMTSDNTASFSSRFRVRRSNYPLLLKVKGGIDLVTGSEPDFQLVSVMRDRDTTEVNINPFSTLIVMIAQRLPGGINADNINMAEDMVTDKLGFGLDPGVIGDPIHTPISDENIASLIKASEAMGEMVRRTRDQVAATGRKTSGDTVLAALAADMVDGMLDGQGISGVDPRISAVAKVVSGQVLVEALANTLKVGGIIATPVIDQSIETTRPGIRSENLTQQVRITEGMLKQTRTVLAAAKVLDASAEVIQLETIVSKLGAGAMSRDVATVLPSESSRALDNAVLLASTADMTQLAAVNAQGEPAGSDIATTTAPVTSDPVTTDPVTTYPNTTEDSSRRTWSRRTWSRTSTTTEPVTSDPVASEPVTTEPATSDPVASEPVTTEPVTSDPVASEPGTTEPVNNDPVVTMPVNHAPVISGSPARSVVAGTTYSFQPVASDADGDTLTFSISGKPSWAGFNTATGRLSGTPGDSDTGTSSNIVIAVTDETDTARLQAFSITVEPAQDPVGGITLTWTAPVTRTDGTPLSLAEIGGYRIYYGTTTGRYPETVDVSDGSAQSATISDLPAGTYHAVMTSYDSNGLESARSAEVVKVTR